MFKIFVPFQKVPKVSMKLLKIAIFYDFLQTKLTLQRKNNFSFRPFLDILQIHLGARKFVSHLKNSKMSLINILEKDCGLQHASEKYGFEVKHPVVLLHELKNVTPYFLFKNTFMFLLY